MKFTGLSIVSLAAVASALVAIDSEQSASSNSNALLACATLKIAFGTQVFYPGSVKYKAENERRSTPEFLVAMTLLTNIFRFLDSHKLPGPNMYLYSTTKS